MLHTLYYSLLAAGLWGARRSGVTSESPGNFTTVEINEVERSVVLEVYPTPHSSY